MPRRLGQHFLRNHATVNRIADLVAAANGAPIVEVGGGHGELTAALLARYPESAIVSIEKDPRFVAGLTQRFTGEARFTVVAGDVRRILPSVVAGAARGGPYALAGNIPYYLTGYLLRIVGELAQKPQRTVFLVQREVAERASVAPPRMNRLAAALGHWSTVSVGGNVSRRDFNPPPAVDSAILVLDARAGALPDRETYMVAVRALFAQPRKTIANNLSAGLHVSGDETARILGSAGIVPGARPQDLSIEHITALARSFSAAKR